jgi:FlaA1/EpsC-like NDP-sugar epimerase
MKKILINYRSALALSHDVCAAIFAWYLAFLLRFNFDIPPEHFGLMNQNIWLVLMVQTISFLTFGLYRSTWRFASLPDLKRILATIFLAGTILAIVFLSFDGSVRVPRSVLIINPILLTFFMGGSRFIYRLLKEYQLFGSYLVKGESVVVYGAGATAISLLKDLAQSQRWRVVALLDDNETMQGREILGVKVQGSILDLAKVANFYKAQHIIIASSTIDHQERRKVLEKANQSGLQVLTIPAIDDLISGRFSVSQIRRVDVEDLLGRDPVSIDTSGLNQLIVNKTVLVSGAGGSIGSELCRQIIKFNPKYIVCLDISEYALYKLEQEFSNLKLSAKFIYLVGDVRHASRLDKIFANYQPRLVFHAAAYKHVPLMEIGNVSEAFNNNVLGTYLLAKASKEAKVEKFVLISTDKAVNPTNVMGATKRLAEMICQGLQDNKGTQFVVVRFGNVLGSSGSVIPKFRQQINAGGPVTVTHPDITRYFMSIPEAAQLVMQASLLGKGREIFVLDMGQPVRILDLARDMIKLSGMSEDEIKIVFSGLRPGEKLYEELLAKEEQTLPTPHKKIRIAFSKKVEKKWLNALLKWMGTMPQKEEILIKKELKFWVKGFKADLNKY